jgi:hypothetical protein
MVTWPDAGEPLVGAAAVPPDVVLALVLGGLELLDELQAAASRPAAASTAVPARRLLSLMGSPLRIRIFTGRM